MFISPSTSQSIIRGISSPMTSHHCLVRNQTQETTSKTQPQSFNHYTPTFDTMLPRQPIVRAARSTGQHFRSPVPRQTLPRRLASTEGPQLTGAADNAFNRERQQVKAHAAATSGTGSFSSRKSRSRSLAYLTFRYLAETLNLVNGLADCIKERRETHLPNSVTIPCLIIASVNAYNLWGEHWEHWSHEPPLEERPEYPYQNIRTKSFPWGDGDKVSESECLTTHI